MTYRCGDYVLQQSEYNNHYMIIHDNGKDDPKMVLHASCTEPLTEQEAREHIDGFLRLRDEVI